METFLDGARLRGMLLGESQPIRACKRLCVRVKGSVQAQTTPLETIQHGPRVRVHARSCFCGAEPPAIPPPLLHAWPCIAAGRSPQEYQKRSG
eukprot:354635-Chlamydomonas_euryale.AAC.13